MVVDTSGLVDTICEQARKLPPDSLRDLAKYVEFLQYKADSDKTEKATTDIKLIVKLGGILKGVDVSPEALAEARRELWHGFGEIEQ